MIPFFDRLQRTSDEVGKFAPQAAAECVSEGGQFPRQLGAGNRERRGETGLLQADDCKQQVTAQCSSQ